MRFAFFIIRLLVIFGVLRYLIGYLVKFVGSTMRPPSSATSHPSRIPQPLPPERGRRELRKDPVCGTFIPIDSSPHKTVNGEVVYFCSVACRDRYKAA